MEIAYGKHPLQKLKVFHYSPDNKHTLLLIHGGAWSDGNNTYDDFHDATAFFMEDPGMAAFNIVGINYRLTPGVVHPLHFKDIVSGIDKLTQTWNISKFLVAGHSVGATMVLQLLNYKQILGNGFEQLHDQTEKTDFEVPNIDGISLETLFFIDGIYDINELVQEYGAQYEAFVDNAFVGAKQYTEAVQTSWRDFSGFEIAPQKVIVVQSLEDELLSLRQTRMFLSFCDRSGVEYTSYEENWGRHEEVYRRKELTEVMISELKNR